MSPPVVAAIPVAGLTVLTVAQEHAKAAGKEARWSHAYARRRQALGVEASAVAALKDVGLDVEAEALASGKGVPR